MDELIEVEIYYHKKSEILTYGIENIPETNKILITKKMAKEATIFIIWVGLVRYCNARPLHRELGEIRIYLFTFQKRTKLNKLIFVN